MAACSAYGCTNRPSKKIPGITFHRFPLNKERREAWVKAVRREHWEPSKCSTLCSAHFTEDQIDRTSLCYVRLRDTAIPNIFESFPSYLQNVKKQRKLPADRSKSSTTVDLNLSTDSCSEVVNSSVCSEIICQSPSKEELKRRLDESEKINERCVKKIRLLQQTKRRNKKKIKNLKLVLKDIEKKKLMEEDTLEILSKASGPNQELLARQLAKAQDRKQSKKYSAELRAFALTLNFYSPRAYCYVRNTFNSCLPHPRTISKWYKHVDAAPGFTSEAFAALTNVVISSQYPLVFSLMIDEMAIRQHVEYDGHVFHGYISVGSELDDDSLPIAKEALVFMVVCINSRWKVPVGYFLIDGMTSVQRANLVKQCLNLLQAAKIKIASLTFDGLAANLSMAKHLGCSLDPKALNTTFTNLDTGETISVFLDPCHMLKLVRNTLAEKKVIVDPDNNFIEWKYISALHELQEGEGLNLGNKLKAAHIQFWKQKMKVRLATQLLSKSVADAIEFCNVELKLPQFRGSEATVAFIRIINNLFDILNSRNIKQYGLKKALCKSNYESVFNLLSVIEIYITSLQVSRNGDKILSSNRKTGFLGFLVCIQSLKTMFQSLVLTEHPVLAYLPLYKISQDHIELFFQAVRFHGGCNNNPTARQFRAAYKKLLIKSEITNSISGNCVPLDELSILNVTSTQSSESIINSSSNGYQAIYCDSGNNLDDKDDFNGHDYLFNASSLSQCAEHIVYYIAGYIVRKLSLKLKCEICIEALQATTPYFRQSLVSYKSNGGLIHPSKDVFLICKKSESAFRKNVNLSGGKHLSTKYGMLYTSNQVLEAVAGQNLFTSLDFHMHDTSPLENHYIHLIRAVVQNYLHIRYMYWAKSVVNNSNSMRQLYTKMILFKGQ